MSRVLSEVLAAVRPVDQSLFPVAAVHLDNLTKPRGSLGRLEELAARLFVISGGVKPTVDPARIYVCAGDHGVAAEGVSLFPQEVTRQMVANFLAGGAGINVLAATAGIDLRVVDAGCLGEPFAPHPRFAGARVASGTANLAEAPAMTREQCEGALLLGVSLAEAAAAEGVRALGTGDMGIANTTPSTALFCAYLGLSPAEITGPGTGLDAGGVGRKAAIVAKGLALHADVVAGGDPVAVLACLGGLEIACLAGLVIGAAACRLPIAVDGFISTAAYVAARAICPTVADYAVISHASAEPGYAPIMAALDQKPLLDLGLRLGEGTGAALALFLMRSACNIYNDMATFASAGVSEG
ncbi:nicotinate-nucleotide--dimethylbenzimidazole phosphoribosyltransferase [Solidesulfovibrio carbinolicus]|uniref:Nicotinate-nucleotide--dimethylbenzimidazole phosphoribosyltransferase n=1 Tax=Solidesulfovibrio carbinolicus TaxID=296842 RepID=A0A4V0YQI1_9BACT|nr:nicotinate-nucleotide--dimethylbenzimidazole phosphoribosyltransferase [Solidesulfovibrio carbinolicus]QAZ66382.1 nicotinate-nucleotide--dimethylbenzimidazole phosphoribosyltransferase [Solidesulfovibrio carbinolicus]